MLSLYFVFIIVKAYLVDCRLNYNNSYVIKLTIKILCIISIIDCAKNENALFVLKEMI